jgi:hypothetical protein
MKRPATSFARHGVVPFVLEDCLSLLDQGWRISSPFVVIRNVFVPRGIVARDERYLIVNYL